MENFVSSETTNEDPLFVAAQSGDLLACEKLLSRGHKWESRHWIAVGHNGDQRLAEFVTDLIGIPTDKWVAASAAWGGHRDLLEWMWTKKFPITHVCHESAVRNYNLDVLKWLHKIMPVPKYEDVCSWAATLRDGSILKWAHENGYHWDEETTSTAAGHGELENLKYARENGCPWNEQCFQTSHKVIIDHLIREKCPGWDEVRKIKEST